jgi:hypothetical protein
MNKIVVHYQDGRNLKGTTTDFFPNKERFHLAPVDAPPGSKAVDVVVSELKAVFFVKDYAGDPQRNDSQEFDPSQRAMGRKIRVRFKDGEEIVGTTQGYQPNRPGFFIVPADPGSNNERCYVVTAATQEVSFV